MLPTRLEASCNVDAVSKKRTSSYQTLFAQLRLAAYRNATAQASTIQSQRNKLTAAIALEIILELQ